MSRSRPHAVGFLLALLPMLHAACGGGASSGGEPAPAQAPSSVTVRSGSDMDVHLATETTASGAEVEATLAVAFAAVEAVYEEAKIPVAERDYVRAIIGNPRFIVRGRLLGHTLSRFLDCGQGPTGMHANSARIEMNIRTTVTPTSAGKVQVSTVLQAVARSMEGTSGNVMACGSSHRLEQEIAARVRARVETKTPIG